MKCLRKALALLELHPGRSLLGVQLAGVLAEVGQLQPALDLATAARVASVDAAVSELARDLLVGLHLDQGSVALAEGLARGISVPVARDYRLATVLRVAGRAEEAAACLGSARDVVPTHDAAAGLRGALAHEAGEQALLTGDLQEALAAFQVAQREWTGARRRAGMLRAVAGEIRARLASGQTPLASELGAAVDFAAERGLVPLEAELLLARGAARARGAVSGAEGDLDRAVALAASTGSRLQEGRARQVRRTVGVIRRDDASRIEQLLAGTVWSER